RLRLGFADRRQRDIDLALVTAFGVPRRFAVTGKQDAHAGYGSLGGGGPAFRSRPVKPRRSAIIPAPPEAPPWENRADPVGIRPVTAYFARFSSFSSCGAGATSCMIHCM